MTLQTGLTFVNQLVFHGFKMHNLSMANLLHVKDMSYGYSNQKETLNSLNFTLKQGETVYIRGESGCGKSTFLKLLNRLLEPTGGGLEFRGNPYTEIDPTELRKTLQLVFQLPFLFPVPVLDNLKMAATDGTIGEIEELMGGFNLPLDLLRSDGNRVSVGQAARLCVIRALLLKPEVLLLDEPTAALDPDNTETFYRTFEAMRKKFNIAVVWVTHNPDRAKDREGRHLLLKKGCLHD